MFNEGVIKTKLFKGGRRLLVGVLIVVLMCTSGAPFVYSAFAQEPSEQGETSSSEPVKDTGDSGGNSSGEQGEGDESTGEEDKPSGKTKTRYTKKNIKLFKKRSTGSSVIATIPKGTKLTVSGIKNKWGKATYNGSTGYVRTTNLSSKPVEVPPPEDEGEKPEVVDPDDIEIIEEPVDEDLIDSESGNSSIENGGDKPKDEEREEDDGIDNSGMRDLDKRKKKDKNWRGKIVIGEGGMAIPQLFQIDDRRKVCTYNGTARSISTSGCSVTSLSMIIAYLTGNTEQTPYTLFYEACEKGYYRGNGLDRASISKLASAYKIKGDWKSLSADSLVATLEGGSPIIAHMGPGYFTERGHYIVLRGVTEDGLILVNDPASRERSARAYEPSMILSETRSGAAFMVFPGSQRKLSKKTKSGKPIEAAIQEGLINMG